MWEEGTIPREGMRQTARAMIQMNYDRLTRWRHAALAVGISLQLLVSTVMDAPKNGVAAMGLAGQAFEVHETLGLSLLAVLIVHWGWSLTGSVKHGIAHLFPWFSKVRLAALRDELRQLRKFRLEYPETPSPLAGAVHGLGLLTATALAATGLVIYLSSDGFLSVNVDSVKDIHGALGTVMWVDLVGHAGMAALHQWLGHRTVTQMFMLK